MLPVYYRTNSEIIYDWNEFYLERSYRTRVIRLACPKFPNLSQLELPASPVYLYIIVWWEFLFLFSWNSSDHSRMTYILKKLWNIH